MAERTLRATVVDFPRKKGRAEKARKEGLNRNKEGSVRKINGKVYVDFIYLEERVREPSGLDWNEKNAKTVREQLDKIAVAIKSGTFRFAEVFPNSRNREHFARRERELMEDEKKTPDHVLCGDHFNAWYDLLKNAGRVTERTLLGYRSLLDLYLIPYFSKLTFGQLNGTDLDRFAAWARERRLRGKPIENKTINKSFTVLKMICRNAAISFGWGNAYNPFFGYKKLPESDAYQDINPFTVEDQRKLIDQLPDHWKPYFRFAFCSGLRAGEQVSIQPEDIDLSAGVLHIRRALTLNEKGQKVMGTTKNRYSRRTIRLIPAMAEALEVQQAIHAQFKAVYFFCTTTGARIDVNNLRDRVWTPALKRAALPYREMKQTRHTFATIALSCGENPLWIAQVLGHRNTDMIINVYGKYMEKARGPMDGGLLNQVFQGANGKKE